MTRIIDTILFLSHFKGWGQEYNLHHKEFDSISPYEYWLTFEYPNEPNEITLLSSDRQEEFSTIEGKIIDYHDSSIQVLIHLLKPSDSSSLELFVPDSNGTFKLSFRSKKYMLKFSLNNRLKTEYLHIDHEDYRHLKYLIKLGRQQPFEHYIIHSKKELKEKEIKETMDCIQRNYFYNSDETWECDNGKDFFIGMSGG